MLRAGAPIDGFGVGTSLTTSSDVPALDCAYKLQEYAGLPRRKRSSGKATWPGRKQVWRSLRCGRAHARATSPRARGRQPCGRAAGCGSSCRTAGGSSRRRHASPTSAPGRRASSHACRPRSRGSSRAGLSGHRRRRAGGAGARGRPRQHGLSCAGVMAARRNAGGATPFLPQSDGRDLVMHAVRIHSFGDANVLKVEDIPVPEPKDNEIVVRVMAASVNPVDYKIRSGKYPGGQAGPVAEGARPRHFRRRRAGRRQSPQVQEVRRRLRHARPRHRRLCRIRAGHRRRGGAEAEAARFRRRRRPCRSPRSPPGRACSTRAG